MARLQAHPQGNTIPNPKKALTATVLYIYQLPFPFFKILLQEREYKINSNPRYFQIYRTQFSIILPFQISGSRTINVHHNSIAKVSNNLHQVRKKDQI